MSKFIIIFCAFLLAGAVCGEEVETKPEKNGAAPTAAEKVKDRVIKDVNDAIEQILNKVNDAQKSAEEQVKKIKDDAQKILNTTEGNFADELKKSDEHKNLNPEDFDFNATECREMRKTTEKIIDIQNFVKGQVSRCASEVVEEAVRYYENMKNSSKVVLKDLFHIKDEAEICVKNINGIGAATRAFLCVNIAAAKGAWAATTNVPAVIRDMGKLSWKLTISGTKLTVCSSAGMYEEGTKQLKVLNQKVNECVAATRALQEAKKSH